MTDPKKTIDQILIGLIQDATNLTAGEDISTQPFFREARTRLLALVREAQERELTRVEYKRPGVTATYIDARLRVVRSELAALAQPARDIDISTKLRYKAHHLLDDWIDGKHQIRSEYSVGTELSKTMWEAREAALTQSVGEEGEGRGRMSKQNDMDDLETWHENKVICPYCKEIVDDDHEFLAGWETLEHETEVTCDSCQKRFELTIELEPFYSTYKIDPPQQPKENLE